MSTGGEKPTVLIVGAGLGGLMLGALLEKADIPYVIFERTASVKPLGSALMIGAAIIPIMEQLEIVDEFLALGKATPEVTVGRENQGPLYTVSTLPQVEYTGYYNYIVARPFFYDLMLRQVPKEKIHFNKRVLTISEKEERVKIQTADNSVYEGDILVGADGAYSAVRKRMYEILKQEGKLPKSDQEELPFKSTCLVGQTTPFKDFADFPEFDKEKCAFYNTMAEEKPYTWVVFATAQNTICWMVIHHLDKASSKAAEDQRFRESENSQWGSHAAQAMCDETREFPLPIGTKKMTMGDLYDLTAPDLISKVMLEEKVFQTWHSGRIGLLGDACHKLNPSGAQGAVSAMHDAIALANLIYALPSTPTSSDIENMFSDYQAERIVPVNESYNNSKALAKVMERGFGGAVALFIRKHFPAWLMKVMLKRGVMTRPTVGYLKEIPLKGTLAPNVSPSTEKAREVFKKQSAGAAAIV
ncbi:hypothetical protein BGX29_004969 [Mortierella sp. GBA35]|nr:hypothetical protein BGX23_012162 [Mortierella sp. AD031]KAF9102080.1 hypothetical protein BGX29_004969 [Mortierella sp. GBA35]KAG0215024.1 hypothetical protein BGX33_001584 [Mortierella sp. NVP41]